MLLKQLKVDGMFPTVSSSPIFPSSLNRPPVQPSKQDAQQDSNTSPLHAVHHTLGERVHDKVVALGDDVGVGISKILGFSGHEPVEAGLETLQENAVHFIG